MAHERGGADLHEHVGDRHALLRIELPAPLDELVHRLHVGGQDELEDGDLPGLRQTSGDRAADGRQRHALDVVGDASGLGRSAAAARQPPPVPPPGRPQALDVLGDDPPFRAGAR